jgi:Tfp pilus assembly protein PilF
MWLRILFLVLLVAASPVFAKEGADSWVEVKSPHFRVLSDGSEKQARHVAGQLERMRAVFHAAFPMARLDPPDPIFVIALKDRKAFQALEPEAYLAKGQLDLAGLFLRAPDKNYVLLRLDAQGEHPYATVYHEYTHLLLSDAEAWLPLWLNEGLAEFFENTDIHEKDADVGQPSRDLLLLLRQNKLLPLETLLAVDAKSPYYHEEQKASIFYAESWALVHMIEDADDKLHARTMADYVEMVSKHVDPVTAGERAFGDLPQMQKALGLYIAQISYRYMKVPVPPGVNEDSFQAAALPLSQGDAIRADFLAYDDRGKDARALLDNVLRDDPKNASAHETMGYIEFRAGNLEAARKWYEQAIALDSQSYLAHYYYAVMSMQSGAAGSAADGAAGQAGAGQAGAGQSAAAVPADQDGRIETSLQAAIKLNPRFAPAYDALATFYGKHHEKLDQAHMMNLRAMALDPSNLGFRLNSASVLQEQDRYKDAIIVLKSASGLAKTPEEAAMLDTRLKQLEEYQTQRTPAEAANKPPRSEYTGDNNARKTISLPAPKHPTEAQHGAKQTAQGVIKAVQCSDQEIEFKVEDGGKAVSLFNNNYYEVPFSASNFTPDGEIHPCTDLEGMKAKVQYFATADKTIDGQILSIEVSK